MKILIIYDWVFKSARSTINEYLWSFEKYSGEECYYLNAAYGIPGYITKISFDAVIYHWSFFDPNVKFSRLDRAGIQRKFKALKRLKGERVAIPQDDYRGSDRMNEFFRVFGVRTVFTPLPPALWEKIYPRDQSGLERYFTVLTGYIDEVAVARLAGFNRPHRSRTIDVGYRGSSPPYWLGRAGLMKWQLTEEFRAAAAPYHLKLDLSNDARDIFYGDDWYKFLADCRVALGCEGGATLHDPDGNIMKRVNDYTGRHPGASFAEVEQACFPGLDGTIQYLVITPRVFDACLTRTCQALIEGEYGGILKAGVHYIEIKRDWSNTAEVIKQIEDVDYCERLADNAHRDIVASGRYTYRSFVRFVLDRIKNESAITPTASPGERRYLKRLRRRGKYPWVYAPATFLTGLGMEAIYRTLLKLKLYKYYKKIEFRINKLTHKNQR